MTIVLYDLAGAGDRRFSPHCWRTRMAIAHKGLDCETRPTRFTGIRTICDGRRRTLPTIEDGETIVSDSLAIADHLEAVHRDRPSLFGGAAGRSLTGFLNGWAGAVLHPALVPLIILDIHERLQPEDQDYFRETRERRFGRTLEEVQADREARVETFRASLGPVRDVLAATPWLGGQAPLYADYILFGALQWARVISPFRPLAGDDPVMSWFERCLDLFDGLGRREPGLW